MSTASKRIKVTQRRSVAGHLQSHKDCIRGLGLRRVGHSVTVEDTAAVRGMINKVSYLLTVEEG
jgi:large subunit ribosomal protein L30